MRVLLAANASYAPPRGGATRSNLAWLRELARAGHECRVVASALSRDAEGVSTGDGITVHSVYEPSHRGALVRKQVQAFQPHWVLVSSEDVGQALLREALESAPGRVVYLAHTPQFFGFGPESWNPNPHGAELIREAARVVAIGHHMARYIQRHSGRAAEVVHPPIYGSGPWEPCACFDSGMVTMINPCAIKGGPIFYGLARWCPDISFGAMPGWGTTAADLEALRGLPNVTVLPNYPDIGDFLRQTRVLLMPSLWYEGFGLIVVEAMLRGIPVVASNSGGLEEAKLGTQFVIPVRPIERYESEIDEHSIPRAVVPEQPLAPWVAAVRALLNDRAVYEAESRAAREAALRFVESVRPDAMERFLLKRRILLAHNSTYFPGHGGGDKSNRLLMEALAARGHACRVVARTAGYGAEEHGQLLAALNRRSIAPQSVEDGVVAYTHSGVEIRTVTGHPNLRSYFTQQIAEFRPDVIVASTDDPAQVLLEAALESSARVVYLARATLALPFGPDCAFPSEEKTAQLRRADSVVGVSEYVARYIREFSAIPAVHVPISLLEPGPWPVLGSFENEFVTMVNPCAVKGIGIFTALAAAMPHVRFAAVPGWGTNAQDLAALRRRPNIHLLDPVDNIDEILRRTRVLLVPSLWAEARSRIVVEAMLRGVPVIASHVGGIPEAKLGVDYLLPVRPIERYQPKLDEHMVPVAEVPAQDITPWREALEKLLTHRDCYNRLSAESRRAALDYASQLSVEPFEALLGEVMLHTTPVARIIPAPGKPASVLESLSPEKRALLALRLKKLASAQDAWFPVKPQSDWRFFCFPEAGAGAASFRGWAQRLPACPARLPGREARLNETPYRRMEPLIRDLADAIRPHLDKPFALFGHSMGAAVAFELARELRRRNLPGPFALAVSAARAPQFRLHHVPGPDPSDPELLDQLRSLEGAPAAVFENRELMELLLPALRADTSLYRNYIYTPESPLDCPIYAFGGSEDPNIRPEHLEAWRLQTNGPFHMRLFPGGHFYFRRNTTEFLDALISLVHE